MHTRASDLERRQSSEVHCSDTNTCLHLRMHMIIDSNLIGNAMQKHREFEYVFMTINRPRHNAQLFTLLIKKNKRTLYKIYATFFVIAIGRSIDDQEVKNHLVRFSMTIRSVNTNGLS